VLLALSFIDGPKVDDWVDAQRDELDEKITCANAPLLETDKVLWNDFEVAFNNAYTHTAKKQEAYIQFMNLSMQGNNVNDYIATFDWLVKCAR
jgi:hypothetical protein